MKGFKDWELDVYALRDQGRSWSQTAREMQRLHPEEFNGLSELQAVRKCRRAGDRRGALDEAVKASRRMRGIPEEPKTKEPMKMLDALKQGARLPELAERLGVSPRVAEAMVQDVRESGYLVQEDEGGLRLSRILPPQENRVKEAWAGEKVVRFGLLGDSHLNSKYTQITFLNELYDRFQAEGLATVYHTGDLDEGERMRPGHQYECYTQGADDHIEEIVRVYPKREGILTKYILGNHDYAFIKHVGLDIGPQISARRRDMVYLGQSAAMIELTDGCTLELRHPGDGSAYSLSYKLQKMIDAMSGGEKPNILAIGHYHKTEYIFYRNIHAFQTGTTCAQTPWMRSKQISAHLGGWVVEAYVNDDGTISRIRQEFVPCYKAIKDDYKNWQ